MERFCRTLLIHCSSHALNGFDQLQWSRGRVYKFSYDRKKRVMDVSTTGDTPAGGSDYRCYRCDITSIISGGPSIAYQYDELSRVIEETQGQSVVSFGYNNEGELINATHGADAIGYTYDVRGLLSSVVAFEGNHQFSCDALGRQVQHNRLGNQLLRYYQVELSAIS